MKITKEQIIDLYNKIKEQYKAINGNDLTTIEITQDGDFIAEETYYTCGDFESVSMLITLDDLALNINDVIAERKRKQEEKKLKFQQQHEENIKRENEEATKKRKLQYEKLKKEFE